MLLDLDTGGGSAPTKSSDQIEPKPEPKRVIVPAQEWEKWASICSAMKLSEAKAGEVVSVPALEHGGYLHAVFSAMYGGNCGENRANAMQLVPAALYKGDTCTYARGPKPEGTVRNRGDYTGMRVSVRGSELVCTKPVHFVRTLPTVQPITRKEAMQYDINARRSGWRALHYKDAEVAWKQLEGHPVAVYTSMDDGDDMAVLLWKYTGHIHEYYLGKQIDVSTLADLAPSTDAPVKLDTPYLQSARPIQAELF